MHIPSDISYQPSAISHICMYYKINVILHFSISILQTSNYVFAVCTVHILCKQNNVSEMFEWNDGEKKEKNNHKESFYQWIDGSLNLCDNHDSIFNCHCHCHPTQTEIQALIQLWRLSLIIILFESSLHTSHSVQMPKNVNSLRKMFIYFIIFIQTSV